MVTKKNEVEEGDRSNLMEHLKSSNYQNSAARNMKNDFFSFKTPAQLQSFGGRPCWRNQGCSYGGI